MVKVEKATLWHLTGMKYRPDITLELRPDGKRLVVRQGSGDDGNEVWIDVDDVKAVTAAMTKAVDTVRANHVVEDGDDD
jgi:hypothetical protein